MFSCFLRILHIFMVDLHWHQAHNRWYPRREKARGAREKWNCFFNLQHFVQSFYCKKWLIWTDADAYNLVRFSSNYLIIFTGCVDACNSCLTEACDGSRSVIPWGRKSVMCHALLGYTAIRYLHSPHGILLSLVVYDFVLSDGRYFLYRTIFNIL